MSNPIHGLGNIQPLSFPSQIERNSGSSPAENQPAFQNLLAESLEQVNSMQLDAQNAVEESLAGGDISQVEVFSSVKKADLALRMMMQIRNKVVAAYHEVQQMRM